MSGGGGAVLTVRVPMAPPKELWPNRRASGWAKTGPTKALRMAAKSAAGNEILTIADGPAALFGATTGTLWLDLVVAWPKGQRRLDQDNAIASCKALIDGLADAMRVNDRRFRIRSFGQTWDRNLGGYVDVVVSDDARDGEG